ncbi:MAG: PBP1A family penicillin-binding protein [Proteobacteria bacterium]|nr:PBP1A family penicillin-binding protein [Pseudomonadota bacterium]
MKKKFKTLYDKLLYSYLARRARYSISVIKWKYVSLNIRKLRKLLLYSVYFILVTSLLTVSGFYYYLAKDLPTLDDITDYKPNIVTTLYSQEGTVIGEFAIEKRYVLPLADIPLQLINAFIAAEDARFFDHPGLDFFSILRAFIKNVREGDVVQGGSTITQQVAKSLLWPEKTLERKAKEAILAYRIEKNLTKDEILHLYLNQIYLGHGAYGVQAAARNYFRKDVKDLTLAEMSTLAGLPQAPSKYSPAINPGKARERHLYVLYRMVEEGFIDIVEATDAMNSELTVYPTKDINGTVAPYFTEHARRYLEKTYGEDALYKEGLTVFTTVDAALQKAAQKSLKKGLFELDKRQGYRGPRKHLKEDEIEGFIKKLQEVLNKKPLEKGEVYEAVVTEVNSRKKYTRVKLGTKMVGRISLKEMAWARTPDPEVLHYKARIKDPAEVFSVGEVIQVKVNSLLNKKGGIKVSLYQEPKVQGAILSINPENGFVKTMVGGFDFNTSKFNRAVQSKRQPGSAFKPIIYSAALDKGYTPSSVIVDSPLRLRSRGGTTWAPKNYDGRYYGRTTFRTALVKSRNIVTIKLVRHMGLDYVIDYARRMGIESYLTKDLSLSLGSSGLSLLELTSAYSVFPAGGKKRQPVFITKIVDRDGNILEQHGTATSQKATAEKSQADFPANNEEMKSLPEDYAISPQTAYVMSSLLQGVVQEGTGARAKALNRPVGGKTGTTNDNIDAWFIGFTPDLVTGTWIGYDEQQSLGKNETGSKAASPVFVDFMSTVYKGKPIRDFTRPDDLDCTKIDIKTGLRAYYGQKENVVIQCYKKGTAPKGRAKKPAPIMKETEIEIKKELNAEAVKKAEEIKTVETEKSDSVISQKKPLKE